MVYLWNGFRHRWQRKVLGFAVPHRISDLSSMIEPAQEHGPVFTQGQGTGVDGNYMTAIGRYSRMWGDQLTAQSDAFSAEWVDQIEIGKYPAAHSLLERRLEVDIGGEDLACVALLQGFELNTACDDQLQPANCPCNSQGIWPSRLRIQITQERLGASRLACDLRVELHRAWTPNLGGLPPFEIKPLNHCISYQLTVPFVVLTAPREGLAVTHGSPIRAEGPTRRRRPGVTSAQIGGHAGMPAAALGLTGFGFELKRHGWRRKRRHLGRYILGLDFGIDAGRYDAETGTMHCDATTQVETPLTVVPSLASYELEPVLVQLDLKNGGSDGPHQLAKELCVNSTEQAPAFSRWQKCDCAPFSGERKRQQTRLEI